MDGAVVAPLKIVTGSAVILRVCVDLYMWGVSASERLLATGGGSSYALLRYVSLGTGVVVLTEDPRRQFSGRPVETLLPLRKSRRVEVGDGSCNAIQRGTHKASYRFGGRRRSMHGNDVYTPIGACFSPRDLVPPRGIWIGVLTQSIDEGEGDSFRSDSLARDATINSDRYRVQYWPVLLIGLKGSRAILACAPHRSRLGSLHGTVEFVSTVVLARHSTSDEIPGSKHLGTQRIVHTRRWLAALVTCLSGQLLVTVGSVGIGSARWWLVRQCSSRVWTLARA